MSWCSGTSILIVPTLSFLFVTFLHICLGELVPKSFAIRASKTVALWTAPPLMAFYYVFFPVIWVLNKASDLVLILVGLGGIDQAEMAHTEEEVRHILGESTAGGYLSRTERRMIENVLNLEEKTARRVMVPRPDIVYLSLSRPLEENLRIARQAGHTRYPLCEDDLATVVGMIHVKDLFRSGGPGNGRPDLRRLARDVPYLPETKHLDELLFEFQRNRVHLALLLDEHGSVTGMITLENVLEELVGPIQDEFDRESPLINPLGPERFEVDAACPVDVLAERCGVRVPETEAETAGGLILDLLGRMAVEGDHVQIDGHRLTVLNADPRRIRRILVEPAPGPTESSPNRIHRHPGKFFVRNEMKRSLGRSGPRPAVVDEQPRSSGPVVGSDVRAVPGVLRPVAVDRLGAGGVPAQPRENLQSDLHALPRRRRPRPPRGHESRRRWNTVSAPWRTPTSRPSI